MNARKWREKVEVLFKGPLNLATDAVKYIVKTSSFMACHSFQIMSPFWALIK